MSSRPRLFSTELYLSFFVYARHLIYDLARRSKILMSREQGVRTPTFSVTGKYARRYTMPSIIIAVTYQIYDSFSKLKNIRFKWV